MWNERNGLCGKKKTKKKRRGLSGRAFEVLLYLELKCKCDGGSRSLVGVVNRMPLLILPFFPGFHAGKGLALCMPLGVPCHLSPVPRFVSGRGCAFETMCISLVVWLSFPWDCNAHLPWEKKGNN